MAKPIDMQIDKFPTEKAFKEKVQAFFHLTETSDTAKVIAVTSFFHNVADTLDSVMYPKAYDSKPTGFEDKYWELSDRFHAFLDKLVFLDDNNKMVSKVRILISGGRNYDEFHSEIKSGEHNNRCPVFLNDEVVSYRCSTCSSGSVVLPLCYNCFVANGHEDHEFATDFYFNGQCGCGDPEFCYTSGNCVDHDQSGPSTNVSKRTQSSSLMGYIIMKIFVRLLTAFRYTCTDIAHMDHGLRGKQFLPNLANSLSMKMASYRPTLDFLFEILNYGKALRDIAVEILMDEKLYSLLTTGDTPKDAKKCTALSKLDWRSRKQFKVFTDLFFTPAVYTAFPHMTKYFKIETLLHEFLFFFIFSLYQRALMDIMSSLMTSRPLEAMASKIFFTYYPAVMLFYKSCEKVCNINNENRQCAYDACDCNLHYAHQILNNSQITKKLQDDIDLTHIILSALHHIAFTYNFLPTGVTINTSPDPAKAAEVKFSMSQYSAKVSRDPLVTLTMISKDINQLWKHKDMALLFLKRKDCLKMYIDVLLKLHNMNLVYISEPECKLMNRSGMLEYLLSSRALEHFKEVFHLCDREHLTFYFTELCNTLEKHTCRDDFTENNYTTFNLPLERQISTLIQYFYKSGQFADVLNNFFKKKALFFRRSVYLILRELACGLETRNHLWKNLNGEVRAALNCMFHSYFRSYFGDMDIKFLRMALGSLPKEDFFDVFDNCYSQEETLCFSTVPCSAEQEVFKVGQDLYEPHNEGMLSHCKRFGVIYSAEAFKYVGYNISLLKSDSQTSLPNVDHTNIKLENTSPDCKEEVTDFRFMESFAVELMNLLAYLMINPDGSDIPEEELLKIKLVHLIQNHPMKFGSIRVNALGYGHPLIVPSGSHLFEMVKKMCKVPYDSSVRNVVMQEKKYIIKKEYYEAYWCPILSTFAHGNPTLFSAACNVIEALDNEKFPVEKSKVDWWIPYRLPMNYKHPDYISKLYSFIQCEQFFTIIHTCLALNAQEKLQHTTLQLVVYLLTLSVYYLLEAEESIKKEAIQLFFKMYNITTDGESLQCCSVFSVMAKLFETYARRHDDPDKCYESVFNGEYCASKLAGGPIEYIGRFLSFLVKVEPIAGAVLSYSYEPKEKKRVIGAKASCPKDLQRKILANARKRSEAIFKKFENEVSESIEKAPEQRKDEYDCPICFNATESNNDSMCFGVIDRECVITTLDSPVFPNPQILEGEENGPGNIIRRRFGRYAAWQREVAQEQSCPTYNCFIDWRTCGHTFHATCFRNFKNSKVANDLLIFTSQTFCSVCRYDLHSLLPIKMSNDRGDALPNCFNENGVITIGKLMEVLNTVVRQTEWKYLNESDRESRLVHYAKTNALMLSGSKRIKEKPSITALDRIRQHTEILSKLQRNGWEKAKVGIKEKLLRHMVPIVLYKITKKDETIITETVRDLLYPQGTHTLKIEKEGISSYFLETDVTIDMETKEEAAERMNLTPEDAATLDELQKGYGFKTGFEFSDIEFKSTEHLLKRDLINAFILTVTAITESNLLENDRIAICHILHSRLIGAYLVKTLVLLVPCVTEKCAAYLSTYEGSGLLGLCKAVFTSRYNTRKCKDIEYFDEETGLDETSLILQTTQSMIDFVQIVQTFLSELSILNIDSNLEALCNFYRKNDISEFVPNQLFLENWLTDLDGTIGCNKHYQTQVPILSWKTKLFIDLPDKFSVLAKAIIDAPCTCCGETIYAPIVCLHCGEGICEMHLSPPELQEPDTKRRWQDHRCQAEFGAYINLQTAEVVIATDGQCAVYGRIYITKFEEDPDLVISELYLCHKRLEAFELDFVLCNYSKRSFLERDYFVEMLQTARRTPFKFDRLFTNLC